MKCTKCGRETPSEGVFCDSCLADMKRYPVKPGTVIQLPARKPKPTKRSAPKKIYSQEEQLAHQRRTIRILRVGLICTLLLLVLTVIMLVQLAPKA